MDKILLMTVMMLFAFLTLRCHATGTDHDVYPGPDVNKAALKETVAFLTTIRPFIVIPISIKRRIGWIH